MRGEQRNRGDGHDEHDQQHQRDARHVPLPRKRELGANRAGIDARRECRFDGANAFVLAHRLERDDDAIEACVRQNELHAAVLKLEPAARLQAVIGEDTRDRGARIRRGGRPGVARERSAFVEQRARPLQRFRVARRLSARALDVRLQRLPCERPQRGDDHRRGARDRDAPLARGGAVPGGGERRGTSPALMATA